MAWLAVGKDGQEMVFCAKPVRTVWCGFPMWIPDETLLETYLQNFVELPRGSIEKLIGRKLTWEDNPVEITQ